MWDKQEKEDFYREGQSQDNLGKTLVMKETRGSPTAYGGMVLILEQRNSTIGIRIKYHYKSRHPSENNINQTDSYSGENDNILPSLMQLSYMANILREEIIYMHQ